MVKVRFQSAAKTPPYSSIPNAFHTIYTTKGLRGLYIGTSATVTRAAFLTAAELGSYDIIKNNILVAVFGFDKEDNMTHFAASFAASLIATTAANPADVVKTRVMNGEQYLSWLHLLFICCILHSSYGTSFNL